MGVGCMDNLFNGQPCTESRESGSEEARESRYQTQIPSFRKQQCMRAASTTGGIGCLLAAVGRQADDAQEQHRELPHAHSRPETR